MDNTTALSAPDHPISGWHVIRPGEPTGLSFTAQDVIDWAELPKWLGPKKQMVDFGEADGKSLLGTMVMVLNGGQLVEWLKVNSYGYHSTPKIIEASESALEVYVEVGSSQGGKPIELILYADGSQQGVG